MAKRSCWLAADGNCGATRSVDSALTPPLRLKWKRHVGALVYSLVANDQYLVAAGSRGLKAFRFADGKQVWSRPGSAREYMMCPLVADSQAVYAAVPDLPEYRPGAYAYDWASGRQRWHLKLPAHSRLVPQYDCCGEGIWTIGRTVIDTHKGRIIRSGKQVPKANRLYGRGYEICSEDLTDQRFDHGQSQPVWVKTWKPNKREGSFSRGPLVCEDVLVRGGKTAQALDANTGEHLYSVRARVQSMAAHKDRLYVIYARGSRWDRVRRLVCFNLYTGKRYWVCPHRIIDENWCRLPECSAPIATDDFVWYCFQGLGPHRGSGYAGAVVAVDAASGRVAWQYHFLGRYGTMAATEKYLLLEVGSCVLCFEHMF